MKGSNILFCNKGGRKINIFSHPFSNMFGLSQRCIIVAKNGGKIIINEGVGMSGCTIYSMESITIGRNTDIGSGCKIIDNDFHPLPYRAQGKFSVDSPSPSLTKFLSTTEHEERQVADSMHYFVLSPFTVYHHCSVRF